MKMLNKEEFEELIHLIDLIEIEDCFSRKDLLRREQLESKLSENQCIKLYEMYENLPDIAEQYNR